MTLNKKFLMQMMKLIHNEPKLQIEKNVALEAKNYKSEEIQAQRMSQFEKDLALKKANFDQIMNVQKPPVPNFTEKINDDKIKGMDELIARTISERNFDIEQIHNTQEPSLKLKKLQSNTSNNSKNEINYIKIENDVPNEIIKEDLIELSKNKKISWSNENQINYYRNEQQITKVDPDILSKFKKSNITSSPDKYVTIDEYNSLKEQVTNMDKKIDSLILLLEKINTTNTNVDTNLATNLDTNVDTNLDTKLDTNLDTNVDTNLDTNVDTNVDTNLDTNVDTNLDNNLDTK